MRYGLITAMALAATTVFPPATESANLDAATYLSLIDAAHECRHKARYFTFLAGADIASRAGDQLDAAAQNVRVTANSEPKEDGYWRYRCKEARERREALIKELEASLGVEAQRRPRAADITVINMNDEYAVSPEVRELMDLRHLPKRCHSVQGGAEHTAWQSGSRFD